MKLQNELPKMVGAFTRLNNITSIQDYVNSLKISGGYKDLKTRASWDVFWTCLHRGYLGDNYLELLNVNYHANDSHIDTLIKKAMDKISINF